MVNRVMMAIKSPRSATTVKLPVRCATVIVRNHVYRLQEMAFYRRMRVSATITKSQRSAPTDNGCTVATVSASVDGQTSFCGDGLVDRLSGETCDDQNDDETDGCLSNCRRGSLCGDGFLDEGEDCDGEADTAYCTDECICDITFGEGVYQEPCTQASDCATGLCVENPLASGSAFCTQLCESNGQCPDLDQCVSVGAPSPDICPEVARIRARRHFLYRMPLTRISRSESALIVQSVAFAIRRLILHRLM